MSSSLIQPPEKTSGVSFSSDKTLRELRIKKTEELKSKGHNPYTPYSYRDFTLGFVRFWFDFVHKFDFSLVMDDENDLYNLDYFLQQVLFPRSLLEHMEDKIHIRYTVREMGLDPDKDAKDFEEEFEPQTIELARNLLVNLVNLDLDRRGEYLKLYLSSGGIDSNQSDDEDLDLKINFFPNQKVFLAGRVKSKRVSGKIAFATVEDEENPEGFQFIFKKDILDKADTLTLPVKDPDIKKIFQSPTIPSMNFEDFKNLIDEGDYIQVFGKLDYSQRGQPSLFVEAYTILTKSLRQTVAKIDYQDLEFRYLNRVEDYKVNTRDEKGLSVREMIYLKSKFWKIWREEMEKEGFLEIETPVFKTTPSGAESKPFKTYYNELEQEVFLRMELELAQKKLIAGGFEKIFEIGRQFRNEGSSPQHLQEYTQIEWYCCYKDYYYGMKLTKRIYQRLAQAILGSLIQIDYRKQEINWGDWCSKKEADKHGWKLLQGWPLIPYYEAFKYFSGGKIDVSDKDINELCELGRQLGLELSPKLGMATVLDKIWKKIRVKTRNPFFLILPPAVLEPLAKRSPDNPNLTERFQVVAGGAELGKGFSELNDPLDQFARFYEQQKAADEGNEEAMVMDMDYVKALEFGTPPMAGYGASERLFSFFLGKHIKECLTFPHYKSETKKHEKSNSTQVMHLIMVKKPGVENWKIINTAAHLAAGIAAREGRSLLTQDYHLSKDNQKIYLNISQAILLKQTDSIEELLRIKHLAEEQNLTISCFTSDMQNLTNDSKISLSHKSLSAEKIDWLGISIFGKKYQVEKITESLDLLE